MALRLDMSISGNFGKKGKANNSDNDRLSLDLGESMERSLNMHDMDSTYRQEGVSVSQTRMRIEGEEIYQSVFEKDLVVEKRVGQGACSAVFRARHKKTGEYYALKMFNVFDRQRRQQLQSEIRMLSRIQCDSLIAFYGAYLKEGNIVVILEYMDRGSLEFIMDNDVICTEVAMAGIAYQIIGSVKLSDFGISRDLDSTAAMSSTSVGTFKYMSLDRLLGTDYNTSSDIWSVGIMIIELWEKKYPFEECSSSPIELVQIIEETKNLKDELLPKSKYKPEMKRFVQSMMEVESASRATASECLQSDWFKKWNIDSLDAAQDEVQAWIQTVRPTNHHEHEEEFDEDPDNFDENGNLDMSMSMSTSFKLLKSQGNRGGNRPRFHPRESYDEDFEEDSEEDEGKYMEGKSSEGKRGYK